MKSGKQTGRGQHTTNNNSSKNNKEANAPKLRIIQDNKFCSFEGYNTEILIKKTI
ncbi:MAG: hypothetical protein M3162_07465 [Thermoproteota archaeon]|nr:hypothetical protein [Thermoproteota archaeon]